jgi:hypothetical protein
VEVQVLSQAPSYSRHQFHRNRLLTGGENVIRLLLAFVWVLSLSGCSGSSEDSAATIRAPELEGILVTSSAPVVVANLQEQDLYLYFLTMECDACWKLLEQAEQVREEINLVAVVMSTDNFAVYEKARSHFLMLLPVYADHDENIAYDYDANSAPLWITVNSGRITARSAQMPSAVERILKP